MKFKNQILSLLSIALFCVNISHAQQNTRYVAVTVDDLPFVNHMAYSAKQQLERTDKLLRVFKTYNIPAVGFVNDYKLYDGNVLNFTRLSVLEKWVDNNFELGNHTFSHISLNNVDVEEYKADIIKGERLTKLLLEAKEKDLRYFRYPYLQKGNEELKKIETENFLTSRGCINAPVTIDNSDWVFAKAYDIAIKGNDSLKMKMIGSKYIEYMDIVFEYFEKQSKLLFDREIKQILLIHASALNSDYFGKLAEMIMKRNYRFVSLDEALSDPIYKKEETYVGNWGFSWINRWAITDGKGKDFYKDEPEPAEEIFELAGIKN